MPEFIRSDIEIKKVTIRFYRGGETIPLSNRKTQTLKKCWQQWGVPPWLRQRVPILYSGNEIMMVVGFAVAHPFVAAAHQPNYQVSFFHVIASAAKQSHR